MSALRVYLDHNASTPVRPEVAEIMRAAAEVISANPSSLHASGRLAREKIEDARFRVGRALGCLPEEIIFTGGGSEADNLAIKGSVGARGGGHIVTTAIEHPAVLNPCRYLESTDCTVTRVKPDAFGMIDPEAVAAAVRSETVLVSVMAANNEVGTVQPVREIMKLLSPRGVLLHVDAIQAVGKIPVECPPGDMMAVSAHKIGGPKGVGALYCRSGLELHSLIHGGGQEDGRRSGTENVAGIIGFALALELAVAEVRKYGDRVSSLRDRLETMIESSLPGVSFNGHRTARLPNTLNLSFAGVDGEALVLGLDARGVEVSTGSACSSGKLEPSHVLTAMGFGPERAQSAVRFSLGAATVEEEIRVAAEAVVEVVRSLRGRSR
ncbi:MAG TPA: cysteine desulfurase family protein [bacterium]|nr:cysteine desulfurase family protein [bacterium]